MFDRQRSSKPQLQRQAASKSRQQLETEASQKEVCSCIMSTGTCNSYGSQEGVHAVQARLSELRSTMSKEKAEIAKLM